MGNKASSVPFVPVTWCDGGAVSSLAAFPVTPSRSFIFTGSKRGNFPLLGGRCSNGSKLPSILAFHGLGPFWIPRLTLSMAQFP